MNRVPTAGAGIPTPSTGTTAPAAPTSLTAPVGTAIGAGNVRLTCPSPTSTGGSPITDYVIQRSPDGGTTWTTLSDGVSTSLTYTATGLTNGAMYSFRVAARNDR